MLKHCCRVATALALGVISAAQAQDKSLYLGSYGGSFETIVRERVLPAFQQANGVRVAYVSGNHAGGHRIVAHLGEVVNLRVVRPGLQLGAETKPLGLIHRPVIDDDGIHVGLVPLAWILANVSVELPPGRARPPFSTLRRGKMPVPRSGICHGRCGDRSAAPR
jgi:hypothetical protein